MLFVLPLQSITLKVINCSGARTCDIKHARSETAPRAVTAALKECSFP